MCRKIAFLLISLTLMLLLLAPSSSPGQGRGGFGGGGFGGGGFGGGGFKGGFGGPRGDPNQMFDFLAKGRPYFLTTESNRLRAPLDQFLQTKGITSGQVTRELFSAFNDQMRANMGVPGGFGGPGMFPGQGGGNGPFPGFGGPGGRNPIDALNQLAEADFNLRDRNGDGFLNQDEMPEQLKAELSKWDTNRDNLISLDEYKIYYVTQRQNRRGGGDQKEINPVTIILEDEDLDVRPVVYRAGKLPTKELPKWFMELDTDKDGQIALYEWRKGGRDLDEFREWDRNNDGFITVEEALYKQRQDQIALVSASSENGESLSPSMMNAPKGPNTGPGGNDRWGGGKKGGKGGKGNFNRAQ